MLISEIRTLEQMLVDVDVALSGALSDKEAAHSQLLHVLSAYVERRESCRQHSTPQETSPHPEQAIDSVETDAQIVARASVIDAWPISVRSC